MLPYTVIKEANPPERQRHRHRRRQLPELHLQRAARPGVRLAAVERSAAAPRRCSSNTTRRRSQPLLYGVGARHRSDVLPEGNRTGGSTPDQPQREARHESHQPEPESTKQLLARCRSLEPVPTAVAHPCEETALAGAIEAAREGADRADPRRPGREDPRDRGGQRHRPRQTRDRRRAAQPCRGGEGRGAGAPGRGRAPDEGQPAHRRAARARSSRARPACAPAAASATSSSWTCRPTTRS